MKKALIKAARGRIRVSIAVFQRREQRQNPGVIGIASGNGRRRTSPEDGPRRFNQGSLKLVFLLLKLVFLLLLAFAPYAVADTVQRIYTVPDPSAGGGIDGSVNLVVTHALAVDHEREHVYRAEMSNGGTTFHFAHIPTGKYDLVFVCKNNTLYEGLALGTEAQRDLSQTSADNLAQRVAKQDEFFDRSFVHRKGFDGPNVFLLVERLRDKPTLTQGGELIHSNFRRLEIMEIAQATDDWQVTTTRHIYREEIPLTDVSFLKHYYVPELGNLRIIDSVKNLGAIELP